MSLAVCITPIIGGTPPNSKRASRGDLLGADASQRLRGWPRLGRGTFVLRRIPGLGAEHDRGMLRPARIEEHGTGERDEVRLAARNDLFGLLRIADESDRTGGDARFLPDALGVRNLITRADRNFGIEHDAAARH